MLLCTPLSFLMLWKFLQNINLMLMLDFSFIPGGDWWVEIRSLLLIVLLVNCYISSLIRVLGYVSFLNLVHLLLRVYGYYFISSLFRPWSCLEHCKS